MVHASVYAHLIIPTYLPTYVSHAAYLPTSVMLPLYKKFANQFSYLKNDSDAILLTLGILLNTVWPDG